MEFDADQFERSGETANLILGQSVTCPNCGKSTQLYIMRQAPPPQKNTAPKPAAPATPLRQQFAAPKASMNFLPWIIVAVLVVVAVFAAYKWHEEKVSRRNVLQVLMEIQSATALGVNPSRYRELVTKADSTMNLEKTTLSRFGNSEFLSCAEKAMQFYRKANREWFDGQASWGAITKQDFEDFQAAGLNVNPADYPHNPPDFVKFMEALGEPVNTNQQNYIVPINKWLSLNWNAADFYIEKMK